VHVELVVRLERRTAPGAVRQPVLVTRNAGSRLARFRTLDPKVVSDVLGHKEVAITLYRYSHALRPTIARGQT
jgi:uncharacterized membrane protein